MTVRLNLAHDLGISDKVILYLLDNQSRLLGGTRNDGDQTAWIQDADRNTALRCQPRFSVAAAFDHHEGICITKLSSDNTLRIL